MEKVVRVSPRYHRWHVDPGVDWVEANTGHAHLDWEIPMSQAALVLDDVWDRHYLRDTEARAEKIIQERLLPLLRACRRSGLRVIHAPSPPQARENPAWARLVAEPEMATSADEWPPSDFRSRQGAFERYALPAEPRDAEREDLRAGKRMHPDVQAEGDEVVIATGEELHRYCKREGILFLFFLGFNTNACILLRDYGTVEMSKRGYDVLIVRDCTTGMESAQTHDELWQTRGAILFLEMFGQYSVSSRQLIAGLPDS